MLKLNYFYKIIAGVSIIGLMALSGTVSAEIAQGDGDPTEMMPGVTFEKRALNGDTVGVLKADEQGETADDAVATVTADGDFLLPTYLLPGNTIVASNDALESDVMPKQTVTAVQPITAKPVSAAPVQSPKPTNIADELDLLLAQTAAMPAPEAQTTTLAAKPREVSGTIQKSKKLLIPLAAVAPKEPAEPVLPVKVRAVAPSQYADQILTRLEQGGEVPFRMPHEMKITFYPGASAFSGQSLKWIKAFAKTALVDPRLIVEVRVSREDSVLQEKRLSLLISALKAAGLSSHQIFVAVVDRPVDTMLLRAVPRPEAKETVLDKTAEKSRAKARRVTKW